MNNKNKIKIISDIIAIICDMLKNNIETSSSGMAESFYDWCEGGDIFYNGFENYSQEEKDYACNIMLAVTKETDQLSLKIYELLENIERGEKNEY